MLRKDAVKINPKFENHPIFNELICGMNFGFMARRGYYLRPEVQAQPAEMKKMGINWVTVNMNICQTQYFSDKIYLDFEFSSGELELAEIVKRLHDQGIRVLFKPCLTPLDGAWMGCVHFPDVELSSQIQGETNNYWEKWFRSFGEGVKYFSDLGERIGVDALIVGAEYFGTEGQSDYWKKMIKTAREYYSQPITYEFTPDSRHTYDLDWFSDLDFLSYSYYPPACAPVSPGKFDRMYAEKAAQNPSYTMEEMADYLHSRRERVESISARFNNLPIAFTEYGVRSAHGCILQPCNSIWDTPYDGQEQADYLEASFRTFSGLPQWMGLFLWKWDETQNRPHYHGDPAGDRGFTIQGKPAEAVMRRWAQKK